jgi:hypothetical protein
MTWAQLVLQVSGRKFIENSDATLSIELELKNSPGGLHPAHIHFILPLRGGDIALALKAVDGLLVKYDHIQNSR